MCSQEKSIEVKKIYNCVSQIQTFTSNHHHMAFYVEPAPYAYNYFDLVKIETLSFGHGYIGKTRYGRIGQFVRVDGNYYRLRPENIHSVYENNHSLYHLFPCMEGKINVFKEDNCNENSEYKYENKRLAHILDDVYVSDMRFYITGTIGDKPFKAMWPAPPNGFSFTSLRFLGFEDPSFVLTDIAMPHKKDLYVHIENDFSLCIRCMQTESRYYSRPDYANLPDRPGYFFLNLVFFATDKITTTVYSKEYINVCGEPYTKCINEEEIRDLCIKKDNGCVNKCESSADTPQKNQ